jgi:hypothetical protein
MEFPSIVSPTPAQQSMRLISNTWRMGVAWRTRSRLADDRKTACHRFYTTGAAVPTDRWLLHIDLTFMETMQWPASR